MNLKRRAWVFNGKKSNFRINHVYRRARRIVQRNHRFPFEKLQELSNLAIPPGYVETLKI